MKLEYFSSSNMKNSLKKYFLVQYRLPQHKIKTKIDLSFYLFIEFCSKSDNFILITLSLSFSFYFFLRNKFIVSFIYEN